MWRTPYVLHSPIQHRFARSVGASLDRNGLYPSLDVHDIHAGHCCSFRVERLFYGASRFAAIHGAPDHLPIHEVIDTVWPAIIIVSTAVYPLGTCFYWAGFRLVVEG